MINANLIVAFFLAIAWSSFIDTRCHKNEKEGPWLIYELHQGCIDELEGAMKHLGVRYEVKYANYDLDPPVVSNICEKYHVIIISNTMRLVEYIIDIFLNRKCEYTKIIVNLANRFDYDKENDNEYYTKVRTFAGLDNVFWAPNNIFEIEWLRVKHIINFIPSDRIVVCEPFGYYRTIPADKWPETLIEKKGFALKRSEFFDKYLKKLNDYDLFAKNVEIYTWVDKKHGGPDHLRFAYDWHFFVAYQFSLMKFYEYIRAGIVMIQPSPELFKSIVMEMSNENSLEYAIPQMLQLMFSIRFDNWEEYMQSYKTKNRNLLIEYNSWEELRQWLINGIPFDLKEKRLEMKEAIEKHDIEVEKAWRKLFQVMDIKAYEYLIS